MRLFRAFRLFPLPPGEDQGGAPVSLATIVRTWQFTLTSVPSPKGGTTKRTWHQFGLCSILQTVDQVVRQADATHLALSGGDVVLDAVVLYGGAVVVKQCVAGARVVVSRLPHTSGVEYATFGIQRYALTFRQREEQGQSSVVPAYERVVGMPHEAVGGCQQFKSGKGLRRVQEILDYRIAQAAMYQRERRLSAHRRQPGKEVLFVRIQLPRRPANRGVGCAVEIGCVYNAGGGIIVISGHRHKLKPPHTLQAGRGVRPVSYQVPQAPDTVEPSMTGSVGQYGLQGFQIGMYIGHDEGSQYVSCALKHRRDYELQAASPAMGYYINRIQSTLTPSLSLGEDS